MKKNKDKNQPGKTETAADSSATDNAAKSKANEPLDLYSTHHNSRFVLNPIDLKNFPGEAI